MTTFPISPSPHISSEMIVAIPAKATLSEIERGCALAKALGGRFTPALHAFHLRPYNAKRWRILFENGFTAFRRQDRVLFARTKDGNSAIVTGPELGIYSAMESIRREQKGAVALEDLP